MELKDWLKKIRKSRGLTLTDLQLMTGINNGQLSRLETGVSSWTLFSTVRIFHAFNLSWSSLFSEGIIEGNIRDMVFYQDHDVLSSDLSCINFNDIDALTGSGIIQTGRASELIVSLIKMFLLEFDLKLNKEEFNAFSQSLHAYLGDTKIAIPVRLSEALGQVSFTYPMELDTSRLREIYFAGGVLIMQDLSFYIKQLRKQKNISLREQAKAIEITHPALFALEERMNERVKLLDILSLDKTLELNGELLVFAWRTAELYLGTSQIVSKRKREVYLRQAVEIQIIEKLIILSRLFLYHFPTEFKWLNWYRKKSLAGFKEFK